VLIWYRNKFETGRSFSFQQLFSDFHFKSTCKTAIPTMTRRSREVDPSSENNNGDTTIADDTICSVSGGSSNKRRLTGGPAGNNTLLKDISFAEFRQATVDKYPNLSFLGPASMAVYFIKEWLRDDFGWVRYDAPSCKQPNGTRRRQRQQKKPFHFYFIPGDYKYYSDHEKVLQVGTQGMHYATSYISIYNMVRKYGRFAQRQDDGDGEVVLVGYNGPSLPSLEDEKI
jgi:hypothetical protein